MIKFNKDINTEKLFKELDGVSKRYTQWFNQETEDDWDNMSMFMIKYLETCEELRNVLNKEVN